MIIDTESSIQPFRESDVAVGRCAECREEIYSGDLAYLIGGEIYCIGCVRRSAVIAASSEAELL